MTAPRFKTVLAAIAAALTLTSCAGPLLQPEPPKKPPQAADSGQAAASAPLPARRNTYAACLRDGEVCGHGANDAACCPGFICVGTRGGVCSSMN